MTAPSSEFDNNPVVITTVNNKYALPLAVMLASLQANLAESTLVRVHILHSGVPLRTRREIERCVDADILSIEWHQVEAGAFEGLKVDMHMSIDTYFRLLIESLFPQYSKALYLDADLVVSRSICELWNMDIGGKHLLAAPNVYKKSGIVSEERGLPAYRYLGIPSDARTFNAGVMVLNLSLWRRDRTSQKVLEYLHEYSDYVLWWDQDGLNAILHDKWAPLPCAWNVQTNHLRFIQSANDLMIAPHEYQEIVSDPAIVHYAGGSKPWLPNYPGEFEKLFFDYVISLTSVELKRRYRGRVFDSLND